MRSNKKLKVKEFLGSKELSSCQELVQFVNLNNLIQEEIFKIIELESPYKSDLGTGFSRTSILYYYG